MDKKVFKELLKVIDYMTDSEMKHWEESGEPKKGHIFNSVKALKSWAIKDVLDGKGLQEQERTLLGHVGVDSGQIVITDPCYIDSYWDKDRNMEDWRIYRNKKSGKLYQYKSNTPQFFDKGKTATMFAHYDEMVDKGKTMNQLIEGKEVVPVPKPTDYKGEFSYRSCCEKTLAKTADKDGQLTNKIGADIGVVSCSGYGDGHYPVYAEFIDEGMGKRVSRLTIDFMGTYSQEFMRGLQKGGKK